MLILDTTRKTFGGKEVAEKQVARFVQMLRRWAVKHQGCVIMTAHPSNEGVQSGSGLAGSRAWNNDVRSRMYLTADKSDGKPNHRLLKTMKNNYAANGGKVEIVWERGVFRRVDQPLIKDWTEPAGW
jgi:RecA-family ATPase